MKEREFLKVMVELNSGEIVDITDLPKEQYEAFLELMNYIRLAYITATR